MRYSHASPRTAITTATMKAIGTKLTLLVSRSMTSVLIGPAGKSRRRSAAPSRMLNVPSVAMIDGSLRTQTRTALKIPVARPIADDRQGSGEQLPARCVVRQRVGRDDDAERHERGHRDVEPADEERERLSEGDECQRQSQEEQVVEVEAREEGVLPDGREGADRDDQDRHEDERQRAAELADPHAGSSGLAVACSLAPAREPTIASTIRRSPSSSPGISSTIFPRDITTTRSQRPASSSGSLDLTIVATPSFAFSRNAS